LRSGGQSVSLPRNQLERSMIQKILALVAAATVYAMPLLAADLTILSAGAVEPGVHALTELLKTKHGISAVVRFATAPAIQKKVTEGGGAHIVIAPVAVIAQIAGSGKADAAQQTLVGKVGVGVTVKRGAPVPDISSTAAFKEAMIAADSIVYNQASTGNYVHGLFAKLGIGAQIESKTKRYPDGEAVMAHVLAGSGREIGLGAMTEIKLYADKGLVFVGPLPSEVQNYTSYAAAPTTGSNFSADSAKFLDVLRSSEGRQLLASRGIE
jgi:molybdate transport system substrate-binding protein